MANDRPPHHARPARRGLGDLRVGRGRRSAWEAEGVKMRARSLRPVNVVGDFAYVPLTRGAAAIIDAADVELIGRYNWALYAPGRQTSYARTSQLRKPGENGHVYMHRLIIGAAAGEEVDHINGDGLDNRRHNLRIATKEENARNQPIRRSNRSGFKGVGWHKKVGRWRARIAAGERRLELGYFDTPEAAHAAYCRAAEEVHGPFARTD